MEPAVNKKTFTKIRNERKEKENQKLELAYSKWAEERDYVLNTIWETFIQINAYETNGEIVNDSIWNSRVFNDWYQMMRTKTSEDIFNLFYETIEELRLIKTGKPDPKRETPQPVQSREKKEINQDHKEILRQRLTKIREAQKQRRGVKVVKKKAPQAKEEEEDSDQLVDVDVTPMTEKEYEEEQQMLIENGYYDCNFD